MVVLRIYKCPLCYLTFHSGDSVVQHVTKWHRADIKTLRVVHGVNGELLGVKFVEPYVYKYQQQNVPR